MWGLPLLGDAFPLRLLLAGHLGLLRFLDLVALTIRAMWRYGVLTAGSCSVALCCYLQLCAASCCKLLFVAICCYVLRRVLSVICCSLLLSVAICRSLLRSAAV